MDLEDLIGGALIWTGMVTARVVDRWLDWCLGLVPDDSEPTGLAHVDNLLERIERGLGKCRAAR